MAVLLATEAVLTSPIATRTVNRIAGKYIDGDISFGRVSLSVLKRFPNICLVLDDFSITYPADRFDASEKSGVQGELMYQGCGQQVDTLASFDRFYTKVSIFHLLADRLRIPDIELYGPRIFAHSYRDGRANWDIFKLETDPDDTTRTVLPKISIGRIKLEGYPHIVYTSSKDTMFAMADLNRAQFDGRLTTGKYSKNRIGLELDSMFVAGRIAEDTLAVGIDRLHIHEHGDHADISMAMKTLIATRTFGRLNIPVDLFGTVHFPEDTVPALGVHGFKAEIASVPMELDADLRFLEGKTEIDGRMSVSECNVDDIIHEFVEKFIPDTRYIKTDASLSIDATCKGDYVYGSGRLPVFRVDLNVPESTISHSVLDKSMTLALDAYVAGTRKGAVNVTVNEVKASSSGLELNAYGGMKDIMSEDPLLNIDGNLSVILDSLAVLLPDSLDLTAEGRLSGKIQGNARLSHLGLYTFSQAELEGEISADNIKVKSDADSLDLSIDGLEMKLGPETVTSQVDTGQSFRLVGVTGHIADFRAYYKGKMEAVGEDVSISAKSSAVTADTTDIQRIGGRIGAKTLSLTDASGASVELSRTQNGFQIMPSRDNPLVPYLSLSSSSKRITLANDVNRAILTDADINASAEMRTASTGPRQRRDSTARVRRDTPEWMQEEDFKKSDIDIRLDQSLARYFREWKLQGGVNVRTGIIMTPYFPLRNILRGLELNFTNDKIAVDSFKVVSGKSGIEAKGELSGLRRALAGSGRRASVLKLDMELATDGMDANELLSAYRSGANFDPDAAKDKMADASDAEFLKMVITDTVAAHEEIPLIVIPANLNADIRVNGNGINYSDLTIDRFDANLIMKERCVQITNTMATSNMGDVSFEGFYATRTKEDIKAGFNFEFKDITAEKAIGLMPSVDTIMPMLKSFAGQLDCQLAATASLDTNMNILTPSINGVLRISGDDLTISNSEMFTSLAKKLKFDNRKVGTIDQMTVEGVIKDNILEVFPFVLKIDRYTLALSGKQNLDKSYRYHASIIKSPILVKVGVDVYGPDFDNMKFKIGKPKYRNEKVPVFTTVIDQTRINLIESIRGIFEKGVDAAVRENANQEAIGNLKVNIGYVNAVDQETEELSAEEQKQLENETMTEKETENIQ